MIPTSFLHNLKTHISNQSQHNKKTMENINALHNLMNQNIAYSNFLIQLKQWQGPQPFSIHNYSFWIYLLIAGITLIGAMLIHPYLILLTFAIIIYAFIQRQSSTPYKKLIQNLEAFTFTQKYQLQFQQPDTFPLAPTLFNFPLFQLGNHQNDIQNQAYGTWDINSRIQPFMLFNYHYIDRIEHRDSEGKKKVKYEHHDLWGILIHNMSMQGISISANQQRACRLGLKWSSSDIQFNQHYQLSGTNEMQLAKFFSPVHILKLDQAMREYSGDLYIHPDSPSLLWLFKKDILKTHSTLSSIQSIEDLALYLEHLSMPQFEHLEQQLTTLLKEIEH